MTRKAHIPAGTRFGRLEVLEYCGNSRDPKHPTYRCRCDCGHETFVQRNNFARTHSCGCLKREVSGAKNRRHALSASPEYHIWSDIKQRCSNQTRKEWPNYGGRGIRVCQRWLDAFEHFYADLGPRPTPRHTIERTDNNGDYTPENCRWDTRTAQARNRRNTARHTFRGVTGIVTDLAKHFGLPYSAVYQRLNTMHWSLEKALTTPVQQRKPYS